MASTTHTLTGTQPATAKHTWPATGQTLAPASAAMATPPSPTNWFSETFISTNPRSVVALALRSGISDIIQELQPELVTRAQGTISAELLDSPTPLKKVFRLFEFLDENFTDGELIRAFQRAVVKRGGVEYLTNPDLPTVLAQTRKG
ncbi:hypothetical protein C8F01DRAFT_1259060 [Mycena amicta]|nr:hypothetical protein C8F01DRAFT_1259060 [Mycena amicta]